jgi:hypothetical protein
LGVSGGLVAASVLVPEFFIDRALDTPPCGECDPAALNPIDRPVTRWHWSAARPISDTTLLLTVLSPYLLSGVEGLDDAWATEAVVYTETLSVTILITQLVKYSVRRARPFTYNPDAPQSEKLRYKAKLSLFSGHTSVSFSMATAAAMTYQLRHPDEDSRWVVWGTTMTLAGVTAALRVAGGQHFFSDVLLGAAAGAAVGVVVPTLHRRSGPSTAQTATITPTGVRFVW